MGGVNAARVLRSPNGKPLRSKWKSPEQIKKLRDEGKCFRCERKRCNTKICRLLLAKKPEPQITSINVNEISELDPEVYEEDDGYDESENL